MLLFLHIDDHLGEFFNQNSYILHLLRTKIAAVSDSVFLYRHHFGFIVLAFGNKA